MRGSKTELSCGSAPRWRPRSWLWRKSAAFAPRQHAAEGVKQSKERGSAVDELKRGLKKRSCAAARAFSDRRSHAGAQRRQSTGHAATSYALRARVEDLKRGRKAQSGCEAACDKRTTTGEGRRLRLRSADAAGTADRRCSTSSGSQRVRHGEVGERRQRAERARTRARVGLDPREHTKCARRSAAKRDASDYEVKSQVARCSGRAGQRERKLECRRARGVAKNPIFPAKSHLQGCTRSALSGQNVQRWLHHVAMCASARLLAFACQSGAF